MLNDIIYYKTSIVTALAAHKSMALYFRYFFLIADNRCSINLQIRGQLYKGMIAVQNANHSRKGLAV